VHGYHNVTNFITAIYFHCGALDMSPLATLNPEKQKIFIFWHGILN
jgi:hypothetical protein